MKRYLFIIYYINIDSVKDDPSVINSILNRFYEEIDINQSEEEKRYLHIIQNIIPVSDQPTKVDFFGFPDSRLQDEDVDFFRNLQNDIKTSIKDMVEVHKDKYKRIKKIEYATTF